MCIPRTCRAIGSSPVGGGGAPPAALPPPYRRPALQPDPQRHAVRRTVREQGRDVGDVGALDQARASAGRRVIVVPLLGSVTVQTAGSPGGTGRSRPGRTAP